MRLLILDPFHGAAGDMITAALLDCGADRETVVRAMESVVAEPAITEVSRAGIRALWIKTNATPVHRTPEEVQQRLDAASSRVPAPALAMARRVFDRIAAAEEEVHGARPHFHEVGADDAIADVIGACTALHTLGVEGVEVMPVMLGHGTATGSHGEFPIPAPATAAILQKSTLTAVVGNHVGELCTPTGAALLAEFATFKAPRVTAYSISSIGYGAGTRDPHHAPNVLRAMVVETHGPEGTADDTVDILETNVDDVSGEVIAHALSKFMDAGARDASATPIIMKKGRPGFLIRVICLPETSPAIAELMARELGTLGVRCIPAVHRFVAGRSVESIEIILCGKTAKIPVKIGWIRGTAYTLKAEFDPARQFASDTGVPVSEVLRTVEERAWELVREGVFHPL